MTPRAELPTRGELAYAFVVEHPCARQVATVRAASFRPCVVHYFGDTGAGFFRALQTPTIYIQRQLPCVVFSAWIWDVSIHTLYLAPFTRLWTLAPLLHFTSWFDVRTHTLLPHSGHMVSLHRYHSVIASEEPTTYNLRRIDRHSKHQQGRNKYGCGVWDGCGIYLFTVIPHCTSCGLWRERSSRCDTQGTVSSSTTHELWRACRTLQTRCIA